ncbi:GNAT family N-acetyltransferase [Hyphomonas sp.]|jgi:predicted GNAT family acetyltransferase|uniref:GNAT family N-acetyltransferase n=1 Tax=Hyphomonas sp. TaxID=87 RepID=UPI0025B9EDA9|nr:GNAT family N-acetyltransferase [Hyphomonas sp.]
MISDIHHDAARRRYSLVIDGVEAYLTYERPKPKHRHITHTIVPDALGGRGLGKRLVKRIMEEITADGETVSSSCWFASALIDKSADWAKLLG